MISLPVINPTIVDDTDDYTHMETGDIQVTLTLTEHELINDMIHHALESFQLVAPYNSGIWDLPIDNQILQRYTTLENLRERFSILWIDRFHKIDLVNHEIQ